MTRGLPVPDYQWQAGLITPIQGSPYFGSVPWDWDY